MHRIWEGHKIVLTRLEQAGGMLKRFNLTTIRGQRALSAKISARISSSFFQKQSFLKSNLLEMNDELF